MCCNTVSKKSRAALDHQLVDLSIISLYRLISRSDILFVTNCQLLHHLFLETCIKNTFRTAASFLNWLRFIDYRQNLLFDHLKLSDGIESIAYSYQLNKFWI